MNNDEFKQKVLAAAEEEINIINFFRDAYENNPEDLVRSFHELPLNKKAGAISYIMIRDRELGKKICNLIYGVEV